MLYFERIGQTQRRMHFQINGKSASCARALKTFKLGKLVFDIFTIYNFLPQNEEEVKGNTLVGSFAFCFGIHLYFWWRTLDQANQGIDGIITAFFGKRGTKPSMSPNPISSLISSCLFCSLFYFPVPRASFPYSPFLVLVNLLHSRDQHLCKFGTLKKAYTQ